MSWQIHPHHDREGGWEAEARAKSADVRARAEREAALGASRHSANPGLLSRLLWLALVIGAPVALFALLVLRN